MKNYFWNSLLTEKSWRILQELRKKHDFILIGGWAVYLLTKSQKSKDIDIVVGIKELEKLKQENLSKNDRLKKYEIKKEEIDVDIYLEYYSELAIPVEDIKNYSIQIEGFSIPCPELMLVLKQEAWLNRKDSIKGEKDKIDIASLVFLSEINFKKYFEISKRYKKVSFVESLENLVKEFKDFEKVGLGIRELKMKKKEILEKLKKL